MVSYPFRGWWVVPIGFRQGAAASVPVSMPVLVLGQSPAGQWLLGVPASAALCGLAAAGAGVAVVGQDRRRRSLSWLRWPLAGAGGRLLVVGSGVVPSRLHGPVGWSAWRTAWAAAGPVAWSAVWPVVPVPTRRRWLSSVPGAVVG